MSSIIKHNELKAGKMQRETLGYVRVQLLQVRIGESMKEDSSESWPESLNLELISSVIKRSVDHRGSMGRE